MHRRIVVILAAVDAAIAAAVGLVVILAPLTLVWVLALSGAADWGVLWPTTATLWQFGHAVPLAIELPGEYLGLTGIDPAAASFVLSLAPLGFATFTAVFAARSGRRASRAGAWMTGVLTGTAVFVAVAVAAALTGATSVAAVELWQAIVFPVAFFAVPAVIGAVATEWIDAGDGIVARVRDRIEAAARGWGDVVGLTARGAAIVVTGLVGVGALAVTIAVWGSGGEIIALYEASHVDALGATLLTLGQAAYLPTLVVWAVSFIAGPGFAIGAQTTVAPAGTQVGVLPGIPVLGAIPEHTSPWLLLLALVPVAVGAFAGWVLRSRFAPFTHDGAEPVAPRLTIVAGVAVCAAAVTALFAQLASGSLGPGTLAVTGPAVGPTALAVGLEVAVGAAILLLSPRRLPLARRRDDDETDAAPIEQPPGSAGGGTIGLAAQEEAEDAVPLGVDDPAPHRADDTETQPVEPIDPAALGELFGTRPLDQRRAEEPRDRSID